MLPPQAPLALPLGSVPDVLLLGLEVDARHDAIGIQSRTLHDPSTPSHLPLLSMRACDPDVGVSYLHALGFVAPNVRRARGEATRALTREVCRARADVAETLIDGGKYVRQRKATDACEDLARALVRDGIRRGADGLGAFLDDAVFRRQSGIIARLAGRVAACVRSAGRIGTVMPPLDIWGDTEEHIVHGHSRRDGIVVAYDVVRH